jgi:hypothetical protein
MEKSILGKRIYDRITGFSGIATAVTHYLNGCTRVCIQPQALKEEGGGTMSDEWFDSQQIKVLKSGHFFIKEE